MMKRYIPNHSSLLRVAACAAALAPSSFAQTAPAPAANANTAAEETVVLSPFEVHAEEDTGYQAANTTSGSRLATSLKDTAASVSPFTAEFLSDIAATNLSEMLNYASNIEQDGGDQSGGFGNNGDTDERGGEGFRIRSIAGGSAVDYVNNDAPQDLYNVERAEVASGANSILFGTGAAGGLVSFTTKKANVKRNKYVGSAQFGSWDHERYTVDLNQVVLQDKLALRLNALHGNSGGFRRFDFNDANRYTAAVAYKPFKRTTLNASFEEGIVKQSIGLKWNAADQVTAWLDAGRPAYDGSADAARGTVSLGGTQRFTFFTQEGTVHNLRNELRSLRGLPQHTLLSPALFPYDINWSGPAAKLTRDFTGHQITLEHQFSDDLTVQLAYYKNNTDNTSRGYVYDTNDARYFFGLYGDPNLNIPAVSGTGTVLNPRAGQLYMEAVQRVGRKYTENEVKRATAAYHLDLGKWFGDHRFVGLLERASNSLYNDNRLEVMVNQDNLAAANVGAPENNANRVWRRSYLREGDYESYGHTGLFTPLAPFTSGGNTLFSRLATQGELSTRSDIDTYMFAAQSAWFKRRLVTTFGYRRDDIAALTASGTERITDPNDPRIRSGEKILNELAMIPDYVPVNNEPITRSLGAVWHVHRRFSVFYNESSNVGFSANHHLSKVLPADGSHPPASGLLADPLDGKTQEYGIMIDLLGDDRFFARLTRYETVQLNDLLFPGGNLNNAGDLGVLQTNTIWDALLAGGAISAAQHPGTLFWNATSIDTMSEGYEVELIANPLPNWTIRANYSHTEREREDFYTEGYTYFDRWFPEWRQLAGGNAALLATVEENIAAIQDELDSQAASRLESFGQVPHKATLTTRYRFSEGRFKNLFVGGAVRYRSKVLAQKDGGRMYHANESVFGDVFAGYRFRLPWHKKLQATVQLNVRNVTNSYTVTTARWSAFDASGEPLYPRRLYLREPRSWRLTTTVEF